MTTTLFFFRHSALLIVREHDSKLHAHRAVQLTLALDGPFRVQRSDGSWQSTRFAHFAPEEAHWIVAANGALAYLFVDPGPRVYSAWLAGGGMPRAPGAETIAALQDLTSAGAGSDDAVALAAKWQAQSLPGLSAREAQPDARIAGALERIERDPALSINHRDLAALTHLSVSRFADRFRAATGMPVRNYLLWRRLLQSVEALQAGVSVTQAAHDSGFADAAHLSRSFRRILGAKPSDLGAR